MPHSNQARERMVGGGRKGKKVRIGWVRMSSTQVNSFTALTVHQSTCVYDISDIDATDTMYISGQVGALGGKLSSCSMGGYDVWAHAAD